MGTELIASVGDGRRSPVFKVKRLSLVLLLPFLSLGCGGDYQPPVAPVVPASADGKTGSSKIEPTKGTPRPTKGGKTRYRPGGAPSEQP